MLTFVAVAGVIGMSFFIPLVVISIVADNGLDTVAGLLALMWVVHLPISYGW